MLLVNQLNPQTKIMEMWKVHNITKNTIVYLYFNDFWIWRIKSSQVPMINHFQLQTLYYTSKKYPLWSRQILQNIFNFFTCTAITLCFSISIFIFSYITRDNLHAIHTYMSPVSSVFHTEVTVKIGLKTHYFVRTRVFKWIKRLGSFRT